MTTLFEVPFRSAMRDADLARLRTELGMTTNAHAHHPAVQPPLGLARLDFESGLYLVRRAGNEEWALECRTSGDPAPGTARGWWLLAVHAARLLDPSVPAPSRREGQQVVPRAAARPPSKIPIARR